MADAVETKVEWSAPARGERWTEEVGRRMVEALRRSGQTQGAFARGHGINTQRVKYWVDRVEGGETAAGAPSRGRQGESPAFAPVRIVEATAPASIEVVVGGAVVRVPPRFDEQHLRRIVAALGGATC